MSASDEFHRPVGSPSSVDVAPPPPQISPYIPTTTPVIEQANRLMGLTAHPGFNDLVRISQMLRDNAIAQVVDYPGWDPQEVMVLKARAQAAKEHHMLLLSTIRDTIEKGIMASQEAQADVLSRATADEALAHGDLVRQKVLERFTELETRPAGSY